MLTRWAWIVTTVCLGLGTVLGLATPAAADGIDCPPGQVVDETGRCVITVTNPGEPGDPGDPGDGDDGGGGGPTQCWYGDEEVPCSIDGMPYVSSRGCYAMLADPQPPLSDPIWEGHTDGVIIWCQQPSCLGVTSHDCYSETYWAIDMPGAGPTPRQLADQAVAAMDFRAPEIGLTGKSDDPDSMQIIGLPTWMWVADPDEHTVGPITRSASAGGLTVTATGTLDRIVWSMGDGRSVTCTGASARGTVYEARYKNQASPTCGHRYLRTSASQPHEAYTVTATAYWTINWAGGGQSGTIPLTFARTSQLRVGELQVIVTDGTGR